MATPGDPVDCPDMGAVPERTCLTKDVMNELYNLADQVVANTNVHYGISPGGTLQTTSQAGIRITEDPNHKCIEYDDWKDLYDFLDEVIGHGRTPKKMYQDDGSGSGTNSLTPFPDPVDEDDIQNWEDCNGYWVSLDEVYNCIDLSEEHNPGKIISHLGDCLTLDLFNAFYKALRCLALFECFPDCECPTCVAETRLCTACTSCLTANITAGGWGRTFGMDPVNNDTDCVTDYSASDVELLDSEGDYSDYTGGMTVHITADYIVFRVYIIDGNDGKTYVSRWYLIEGGGETPESPCGAWTRWDPYTQDGIELYSMEETEQALQFDETVSVYFYFGSPPCHDYDSLGFFKTYRAVENNFSMPPFCHDMTGSDWNGYLESQHATPPWQFTGSMNGKQTLVELDLDEEGCRWRLTFKCSDEENGAPVIIWRGYNQDCGGPEGDYPRAEGYSTYPTSISVSIVEPTS